MGSVKVEEPILLFLALNFTSSHITAVFAIITVAWAVQEEVFIVLNPSLTKAHGRHGTRALKFMSKFMLAKVAKLDS